ncbi:stalk domain-containing protein [Cohnella sp. AR92]|uniref:stalk domain-containing protein n=1 Tax=Cohnella sp. AR92 TaxID=648716 RepID=UPI000F8C40B1|nr:copper amine oxidase N-terminal domain-containing protein [Cohnella sp. AR92]RUS48055.1 copper amine oxidase N-terminal domain-containing protein [Cohnella sp. AR92]
MRKPLVYAVLSALLFGSLAPAASAEGAQDGLIASYTLGSLIKSDGTYWIWGENGKSVPTQLHGLTNVTQAFSDGYVEKKDGSLWHWEGKPGSPTGYEIQEIKGIMHPVDVLASSGKVLVLDVEGRVYKMAEESAGPDSAAYALVDGIADVVKMEDDGGIFSFLKRDGSVWRSDAKFDYLWQSTELGGAVDLQQGIVLQQDGTVYDWPESYQSGDWPHIPAQAVAGLPAVRAIWSNGRTNLAIDNENRLWFWGMTVTGASDGTTYHRQAVPVLLANVKNVQSASIVGRAIVAFTKEGKVYQASIERETMPSNAEFKPIAGGISEVRDGRGYMMLQKTDGTLWGWGDINFLRVEGGDDYDSPVQLPAPIEVVLNGESVALSNGVIVRSGQAFIPLRSVFEKLGAKVSWDNESKIATVERAAADPADSVKVQLNFKTGTMTLNGSPVQLQNGLFSAEGSTYLPLRFISESLGAKVDWQAKQGKIAITMA